MDRTKLREYMKANFTLQEVKELSVDIGCNPEDLPHDTLGTLARELIAWCERRSKYNELLQKVAEKKAGEDWAWLKTLTPNS